jgi:hypothetical protein
MGSAGCMAQVMALDKGQDSKMGVPIMRVIKRIDIVVLH